MSSRILLLQSRQKELEEIERRTLVAHLEGRPYTAVNFATQDLSALDLRPFSHIIMSGSSTTISDGELPWFGTAARLIRECLAERRPFLGICFGFQMLAWSLGGRVERGEYAVGPMRIERSTVDQPFFSRLPDSFVANTLHTDYVTKLGELSPAGHSSLNPHEMAFHPRAPLFGVQFHPEHTRASATQMLDVYQETGLGYPDPSLRERVAAFVKEQPPFIEYFLQVR